MSVDFVESYTGRNGSSGSFQAEASDAYPIKSSTTKPFFPPVCLKSHWDPTAMLRRIVPQGPSQPLPLDFRPCVKVCMDYTTSAPTEKAPMPPQGMVFGPGGAFYLLAAIPRPLGMSLYSVVWTDLSEHVKQISMNRTQMAICSIIGF